MGTKKSLFEYDNYREFLRDFYLESKARDKKFSFRYFARIAGFKSFSFLSLVMDGKSNLSPGSVGQLTKAMKLSIEESAYFKNLVNLNQAQTTTERERNAKEILRLRGYRRVHPLSTAQFRYYSEWYFVVVRGLVGLPDFKEDPQWIAEHVVPKITVAEAKRALDELIKLGLIRRDETGRLTQSNSTVSTPNEVTSSSIAQFHREMLKLAGESIDRVPRERRDISAVTVEVSENTAKLIKEMIQKFRLEIAEVVERDTSQRSVYQINLQMFPVADVPDSKGD